MPETEKQDYKLESEFTYFKYRQKVIDEANEVLFNVKNALELVDNPRELRDTALTFAKSAFEQTVENYTCFIVAARHERRYLLAVKALATLVPLAILSNIITATIVWLFLR